MTEEGGERKLEQLLELADGVPAEEKEQLKVWVASPTAEGVRADLLEEKPLEGEALEKEAENPDTRAIVANASLPQKVKLALFGNAICRALLIRDANRMVQQFVMKNPKMTLKEVEEFAKNPNIAEAVLRTIADSRIFMKSNTVRVNLVTNPKTPPGIALKWLRYLPAHEVKRIAKSKNLPQVIALAAKKLGETSSQ